MHRAVPGLPSTGPCLGSVLSVLCTVAQGLVLRVYSFISRSQCPLVFAMCIFCERFKNNDGLDAISSGAPTPAPSAVQTLEAEQCASLRSRQKSATIVTGFLGSGKTTFLNYLLSAPKAPPGLALLINEFGPVAVDDHLLQTAPGTLSEDPVLITMPNGCLCCKVRGDLIAALVALAREDRARHVVIEGSGLAATLPVAQTFYDPRVQPHFRLISVVNVVDAGRFPQQYADASSYGRLVREQLALSNVTLLNKVDLVSPAERQRLVAQLGGMGARVVPCRNSRVNVREVLQEEDWFERVSKGGGHTHLEGVWSVSVAVEGRISAAKATQWLQQVVEGLGERLMRCKGVLRCAGGQGLLVQGVGQHVVMDPAERDPAKSFVVFIGLGDEPVQLQAAFEACLAAPDAEA